MQNEESNKCKNKLNRKQTIQKINKAKVDSLKRLVKLINFIKNKLEKREKIHITDIRNKTGDITASSTNNKYNNAIFKKNFKLINTT